MKIIYLIFLFTVIFITSTFSQNIGLNIGDKAPELNFWNPDSTQQIALSSLQGKIVLVDFWASWCGPCRMENPNLVKNYNKYKNENFNGINGFEIYSVSLDKIRSSWINAIQKDSLKWSAHVSDLTGWLSQPAQIYSINSIPSNYLLDANGIIIAKNLRGAKLDSALNYLSAQDSIWSASPNPFKFSTNITIYNLTSDTITFKIYDKWGNIIADFFTDTIISGTLTFPFNADTLPDGIYYAYCKKNSQTFNKIITKTITAGKSETSNLKFEIKISPNPFTSQTTISSSSNISSIEIYNVFGEKIFESEILNINNTSEINLSSFPKGIYFLKGIINGQPQTVKIIKM